jgi:two-component system, OmpR family, response regulator VicR
MPTKILYVEDEVFLAKIVTESLQSRDFDVKWIEDGGDALPAFRSFKPDICVLDVMLPNKDGFSIGSDIRSINRDMPIIFLTAKSQVEDVLNGFSSGGNDYLKKPFSMEELIVRIDNLLTLSSATHAARYGTFRFGTFDFDPVRMALKSGSSIQKLSHRETELLKLLVQSRNQQVNRQRILRELWGDDSFFNSRNLDVYITKLRKYLKSDPSVQIMTLKGVGYQFITD